MRLPTIRNIEAAESLFDKLTGWQLANDTISTYFNGHPTNVEASIVAVKIVLISSLYYARIFEPLKMAIHIAGLQGIDSELKNGNIIAVDRIAQTDHYEMSFASKYAHFHNENAFPMFDSFAVKAIAVLRGRGFSLQKYADYYDVISSFRNDSGLSSTNWRTIDKYLWLYGQKKDLDKGKGVNKEVTALYRKPETKILFDALEP